MTHENEQIFNKKEGKLDKEALLERYQQLQKEVNTMNAELTEQQKDSKGEDGLPGDFYTTQSLVEQKINEMKEIEGKLKKPQEKEKQEQEKEK